MSKLGSGGLLGNSPALNASRQAAEEAPQEERRMLCAIAQRNMK